RLAFEAPGSFQHSLMVANLAKAGCEAIGADAALAYAGALYHDIGKMERPEYFIENQAPGRNPHDKLQPSMSALVIINHVKKGLSLAREYNLPQPLRDAIAQHHGTRRLDFFFKKAAEKAEKDGTREEVREEEYHYPGPRPRNKVMGILMLADGVEAASRTLVDPSEVKIRDLVRKLVDSCLKEGQLDESDLTLGELSRISEAFQGILSSIYHRRIDYPGFDFNRKTKREAPAERNRPSAADEVRAS
ncbi:MAG: HDIG domain-containing protein, partial [Acidobacteria bacterium]|nr:HDIG domain-containing protein [Acidobacteriota bacterium]